MRKAFGLSIALHAVILILAIWSGKLSLFFFKAKQNDIQIMEAVLVDRTYKPTDTPMMQGEQKKDLPPPKVEPKPEEKLPEVAKKNSKPEKSKPDTKPSNKKNDIKDILKRLRQESKEEDRPPPKLDNFPMTKDGQKDAYGTGGSADRAPTPAEQAITSAMRKYYEIVDRKGLAQRSPNLRGYLRMKLIANGDHFSLVSMSVDESSGNALLDRQCQLAIKQALENEVFSADVLNELSGKEARVVCQP